MIVRLQNNTLNTAILGDDSVPQAIVESFDYGINSNKLYRYESSSDSYSQIYAFDSSHTGFKIMGKSNRLAVLGWTN